MLSEAETRKHAGLKSGIAGIFLNFILFAIKIVTGLVAGSVAIMADAFNNLTDCASSIATIVGFRASAKPADKEHPFGHGRVEILVGLIIAISIIFLGIEFARSSVMRIINPETLNFSWFMVVLLALGFFAKLWMYAFNKRLGKKINSHALLAIATDSRNDCLISVATLATLLLFHFYDINIDAYAGLLLSFILLYSGFKSAKEAISSMLGEPADKATAKAITEIALSTEGVIGVHDLVVHNYGPAQRLATLHIEVDMHMPLSTCHDMVDAIENAVLNKLGITLTIHADPVDTKCQELSELTVLAQAYLAEHHPKADAHEFRISRTAHLPMLIFDLQLPHDLSAEAKEQVLRELKEKIIEANPDISVKINLEHSFIEE
jgi:cation diffusion facilitator family transporter